MSGANAIPQFGGGSGPILMDNVQCLGNETHLINCHSSRQHNCDHFQDAGVECRKGKPITGNLFAYYSTCISKGKINVL